MKALAGSIAIHAVLLASLGGVIATIAARETPADPPTTKIELIEIATNTSTPLPGGSTGAKSEARANAPRIRNPKPIVPKRPASPRSAVSTRLSVADTLAGIADVSSDGSGGGTGTGTGTGTGRGHGAGAGLGAQSGGIDVRTVALPIPRPSKARPAKLLYPSREREVSEGDLFVATVTVDDDGFVVGAKLRQGTSGPRRDDASSLIFRFRYSPALDDDGHAIRSTFDQPFLVSR